MKTCSNYPWGAHQRSSAARSLSSQGGFTLLELLMVIAVIGILATIAVPRFQNAADKAKFTEVINAAGPYKTAVELCVVNKGAASACQAGSNGIPAGFSNGTGRAASLTVVAGVITVTGSSDFSGVASSSNGVETTAAPTYVLTPVVNNGVSWTVGGSCKTSNLCD